LIRRALDTAAFVSFRDASSEAVLRKIGVERRLLFCPDMGWGAPLPEPQDPPSAGKRIRVGVNAMAHLDPRYWTRGDPRRYERYVTNVAAFVALLLGEDCDVVLFSSQTRADALVANDVLADLARQGLAPHPALSSQFGAIEEADELLEALAGFDCVVASRFHVVLLALALGLPTLALSYHAKTNDLLAQVDQASHCIDADTFDPGALHERFVELRDADTAGARETLRERGRSQREAVEDQFDALFAGSESIAPTRQRAVARLPVSLFRTLFRPLGFPDG
jgi:polysaccharide pyruvyl transferase WcaK-like protein